MKYLKPLFYRLSTNFLAIFSGMNLLWHALAIGLTYVIVTSNLDWKYYNYFHDSLIFKLMFPAAVLGFLLPIVVPMVLFLKGRTKPQDRNAGYAVIQAAFLGWLISSIYKAFTGRAHPELLAKNVLDVGTVFLNGTQDITHQFQFGFLRGGIFWGWPSSHTAVAFAIALCLLILFREPRKTKILVLLAAVYIGLGVSISIHWFSDFVAGAIVGSVVGMTVGKSFLTRFKQQL
ncbi:MAG: hypothetical protein A3J07_04885 [Candidatus Doudnabacteria bacterium RIFCSPLOWO2_02_FULL_49_13]|nr:MAG: hypothetical protein A3B77_04525 [Candidatus Doudnabacteria bacterium RIFCSPHIGHO2_02_FULL_49_24]OGE88155.1 MAG: hypothetical protein A2760_02175 [Candidatus Doudnabacteria bacterium RIFCSPHIGHO2_01_FULL_50_67]OGE96526.1 MAG: hypothetical protein A2990_03400 [Candidatus Doudnabacteria bacterium RIFCSPLOWO2_01_FULL_49_40]OGF02700.1 MAG: hypothetical protein A3J07_04885 [Candidatus Doudnabacteria bacterium RIFCSPLOWO2_02_FULL_49_13]